MNAQIFINNIALQLHTCDSTRSMNMSAEIDCNFDYSWHNAKKISLKAGIDNLHYNANGITP